MNQSNWHGTKGIHDVKITFFQQNAYSCVKRPVCPYNSSSHGEQRLLVCLNPPASSDFYSLKYPRGIVPRNSETLHRDHLGSKITRRNKTARGCPRWHFYIQISRNNKAALALRLTLTVPSVASIMRFHCTTVEMHQNIPQSGLTHHYNAYTFQYYNETHICSDQSSITMLLHGPRLRVWQGGKLATRKSEQIESNSHLSDEQRPLIWHPFSPMEWMGT